LVEGELAPSFVLFLLNCHHQDLVERELAPPFFTFLLLLGHHGQVSAKGKLELPLFFLFLVFVSSRHKLAPLPSLDRGGAVVSSSFFLVLFCCF
jgi:hypothetical protein